MTQRRKKLLITQFILLITGLLIIFFTYYNKDNQVTENIISKETGQILKYEDFEMTDIPYFRLYIPKILGTGFIAEKF